VHQDDISFDRNRLSPSPLAGEGLGREGAKAEPRHQRQPFDFRFLGSRELRESLNGYQRSGAGAALLEQHRASEIRESRPVFQSVAIFRETRNGVRPISGAQNQATAMAFGGPRSSCVHPGVHSTLRQNSRNNLTPCRMALHFGSAGAHAPHSDERLGPTATRGSSHSARRLRSLAFLCSSSDTLWSMRTVSLPGQLALRRIHRPMDSKNFGAKFTTSAEIHRGQAAPTGKYRARAAGRKFSRK